MPTVFPRRPLRTASAPPVPADGPIQETLTLIRSHSTIRFAMLPFILGALAVLAHAFYREPGIPRHLTATVALTVAAFACVFETVLSRNLITWWQALRQTPGFDARWGPVVAHRNDQALWSARWALFLPYAVSLVFWFDQLTYHLLRRALGLRVQPDLVSWLPALVALALLALILRQVRGVWQRAEQAGPKTEASS